MAAGMRSILALIKRAEARMRDPERINAVLENIRQIWLREPDTRLGQMLIKVVRPQNPCPELFYLEEKDLLAKLDTYVKGSRAGDDHREVPT